MRNRHWPVVTGWSRDCHFFVVENQAATRSRVPILWSMTSVNDLLRIWPRHVKPKEDTPHALASMLDLGVSLRNGWLCNFWIADESNYRAKIDHIANT
jgi:hypothetical protein